MTATYRGQVPSKQPPIKIRGICCLNTTTTKSVSRVVLALRDVYSQEEFLKKKVAYCHPQLVTKWCSLPPLKSEFICLSTQGLATESSHLGVMAIYAHWGIRCAFHSAIRETKRYSNHSLQFILQGRS